MISVIYKNIDEIVPYENNPRKNAAAVQPVANSIKEFGFKNPVILDKDNVIVAGHTRVLAAKKLGIKEVPCIMADDLTPQQVKAFRLADNRTTEIAEWDEEKLFEEIKGIVDYDMNDFAFDMDEINRLIEGDDETYTMKVDIPQYQITGDKPLVSELFDMTKAEKLIEHIQASGVTDEEKNFLMEAARRHTVFNYRNCAEYYAHADREMQKLMEESALVIIDVDNAIANGYVELSKKLADILDTGER